MTELKEKPPKRQYPEVYEKTLPIFMGLIGLAVFLLIIIAVVVALGIFPG